MTSILLENRVKVQQYADAISKIIGADVDIADQYLIRVAGTGIFEEAIGTDALKDANVIKTVLKTGEPQIILKPRIDEICQLCKDKESCKERIEICYPIIGDNEVLGAIAIGTTQRSVQNLILSNLDNYIQFLKMWCELLASSVIEKRMYVRELASQKTIQKVINQINLGILIVSEDETVNFINEEAKALLRCTEGQIAYLQKINQFIINCHHNNEGDDVIFNIQVRDEKIQFSGKVKYVEINSNQKGRIFVFEKLLEVQRRMVKATAEHTFSFDDIIAKDSTIKQLIQSAKTMATIDKNILIQGESGTGKEMFVRAIYQKSLRKNKPLVRVSCSGVPEVLLENELFGLDEARLGKLALASYGTLYLDEVAELPLRLQRKLKTYIKEKGNDIRLIVTTKHDIEQMVEENRFRADLFYLLRQVEMVIPPIRKREDIHFLLDYHLKKYELIDEHTILLTDEVVEKLRQYQWPGNIREMNSVFGLLSEISMSHEQIDINLLPQYLMEQEQKGHHEELNLEAIERQTIIKALNRYPNSLDGKKKAANALGIGLATLYRKIEKYGIKVMQKYE